MSMYNESLRAFLKPVLPYLDDESVSEIMINGPKDVWIERKGKLTKTETSFTDEGLIGAARNIAQFVGRQLTDERPRLDARLPDGSRIHVVIAPIARKGTTISIRKFFKDKLTPQSLVNFGSITPQMIRCIEAAVLVKLNMLVSGGTGSGKTTLLNILSSLIPNEERILTIEDAAELQLSQEHLVPFESRPADKFGKGEVTMGHLLMSALRLRPDRIVVGEVRGGEAFDLVQAMNTGHGGSMATTHANTPTDSLRRIESLCLMSGIEMPLVAIRAQVASAINFIVCCERLQDGSRKTIAVSEVLPLDAKGEYRTQDLFLYVPVTKDESGKILGYHAPTGILPTFMAKAHAYGFKDLDEKFFDPATYGVPVPPLLHGVGENVTTHWAPSLKHREAGHPDPDEFHDQWRAFEEKLKVDARARNAAAAEKERADAGKPKPPSAQVQVPAAAPARAATPAAPRPAPAPRSMSDEVTPPPTRNPLASRRPVDLADESSDDATNAQLGAAEDEPSVEVDPGAADPQGTNIRVNPLTAPRRPAGSGVPPPRPPGKPIPPKR